MGLIKAWGSHLYHEEKGDGTPILLIPPAGSTASTWGTLAGDLAGAGRVTAYDRRGYTRSGGEVVRSATEHTRDAAAVLDVLEASPAVVAGTSAGAAERPAAGRIESLVEDLRRPRLADRGQVDRADCAG